MTAGRLDMTVVFRADASLSIGAGHVMRCLTLATELAARGGRCRFVCRAHDGNLIERIAASGMEVSVLPAPGKQADGSDLPLTWQDDAAQTAGALAGQEVDWLVVDHYGLPHEWESEMAGHCARLMVIDDFTNRKHCCDVLLNQNLGAREADYAGLVGADTRVLTGPSFALLRQEFARARAEKQRNPYPRATGPKRMLISMGGVDLPNVTGWILERLGNCAAADEWEMTVVIGGQSPHRETLRKTLSEMTIPSRLIVDTTNMAELMADADLAIGAAGSTSWERCCLGLPTVVVVIADNQESIARALVEAGAAVRVQFGEDQAPGAVLADVLGNPDRIAMMAKQAASIADGLGAGRVSDVLFDIVGD